MAESSVSDKKEVRSESGQDITRCQGNRCMSRIWHFGETGSNQIKISYRGLMRSSGREM